MQATIRAYFLPKAGNSDSDYEDAFWPRKPSRQSASMIRLAVGDGATEASFSALWARLLVRDYGLGRLTSGRLPERLAALQRRWRQRVGKEPLPWYAEAKLRDGAFSSLMGLTLEDGPAGDGSPGRWEAMAIGDSCLFHVRGEILVASFPLERSEQFDSRPALVSSVADRNAVVLDAIEVARGEWEVGDIFYLMTDAMACWFLRRVELRDGDPLYFLNQVRDQSAFEEVVGQQRADRTDDGLPMLKNDDVTLVRCSIDRPQ
jgi:hypothetical protein